MARQGGGGWTTDATVTTETTASGRRRITDDPPVSKQDSGAEVKYRVGSKGTEESADESTKWSGE